MSQKPSPPDQDTILHDAWGQVVGGMEWLGSVILGEFADNRPLSAVVVDMLVSFVPGVVILTSARDAVAVILRLASHPEKREDLMEWVLLSACLIVIALPLAMAAAGATAVGVGAVVGGIAGSELGAALRAVMLLLIKEASKLVELVRFLQKFIKGDVLKFLRVVKFAKYERPLLQALSKITGKLVDIVRTLRAHLESLQYFDSIKATIVKLADWEKKFYRVQQDALRQMPRALAELDARLAKVLAQTAPAEAHTVAAGVRADKAMAALPAKQRVRDTPGNVLAKVDYKASTPVRNAAPSASVVTPSKSIPKSKANLLVKDKPEYTKLTDEAPNTKKQAVTDAAVAADRERISQLSRDGKIDEARKILEPHLANAKAATTPAEKKAAMDAIVERLDVTSDKEKMFWSGNKELAAKIATERGKAILEQTPGGKVIDNWDELNKTFSWNAKEMAPHGWDLWGDVSAKYSKDASGEVDVIQDFAKSYPQGGPTWKGREWPTIVDEGKVSSLNILGVDSTGNIIDKMKLKPNSSMARDLFGGK